MAKIETTDIKSLQSALDQAKTDKAAAAELLKSYSSSMYREARLYLDDEATAKQAALRAVKDAYKNISKADAETLSQWLNTYVQDECINEILPLQKAKAASYTTDDEVPDLSAKIASDPAKIKSQLRALLKKLTPSQRLVCILKYRDQISIEEIADLCNATESDVKSILTQVKNKIKNSNISLGLVFAMINRLYPFYKEPEKETKGSQLVLAVNKPKADISEEEQFDLDVQELKDFFNTKAIPVSHISDRDIDDSEDPDSDEIGQTFEMKTIQNISNGVDDTASSAKMIMAAAMSADPDEKVSEKEYNPKRYWMKRIILLLVIAVIGIMIGFVFSMIRDNGKVKPSPQSTPDAAEVEEQNSEGAELAEDISEADEQSDTAK